MTKKAQGTERRFASRTDFDIAVNASSDPNVILLDGETVKGGILPVVSFRTLEGGAIIHMPELQDSA